MRIERHFVTRDEKRFGEIEGFIGKKNIKRESILKNALIDVLNAKNRKIKFSDLREHLNEFKYTEWIGHQEYKAYLYSDPWMVTETPWFRAILIFYREEWVAIIYPGYLNLPLKDSKSFILGNRIGYVSPLDKKVAAELEAFYGDVIANAN